MLFEPEDPWAAYGRTVVRIERTGEQIVVRSAPVGETGQWPWSSPEPLHILTAWDPGARRPGAAANRQQQARFEADLRTRVAHLWRACGLDPATGEVDEGVAVRGLDEAAACALGARYGQDAIFSWSPLEWAIVACRGTRRVVAGWALEPPG